MRASGAEIIIRLLERQGITTLAGIPGGANLPLYDALGRSDTIRHVLTRHEQGAGFLAQGMARVTGKPAVFLATSGPGATNTITALADAKLDSVPVVCITGQVPRAMIGTDAFQEIDTYGLSIPVTKHNFLVRSAEELLEVIPDAFRIAASGRPGPVLVDVPKDVQSEICEFDAWPEPGQPDPLPGALLGSGPEALRQAAEMLRRAARPILYLGGGVVQAGASALARELAEWADIPVVTTLMALGALPYDHPLLLGMLGMHGTPAANLALEECDLLVAVGARFDDRATGLVERFCPKAKFIHADIDAAELGKITNPHLSLAADAAQTLQGLLDELPQMGRPEWRQRVAGLSQEHPSVLPGLDDPRHPYGLIRAAGELAGPAAIAVTDVGQHQMRAAQAYPFQTPRRWLTSGGLGTMGFGLPAAIGAALADPEAPTILFTGDGSMLMNIQELATAVEQQVNLTIVLMDNRCLGLVCQQQDLFYGGRLFASQFSAAPDFAAIARGFGLPALELARCQDPAAALAEAIATPGPVLIHAPVSAEHVYPMVPPGAANSEMLHGERHDHATAIA